MLLAEYALIKDLAAEILEGGAGSGNWGHKGRPGHRGGSAPKGSGISAHVAGSERRVYSRDMAIRIKKKGFTSGSDALQYLKQKYPGQPEDRYQRALGRAGLTVGQTATKSTMLPGGVVNLEKTIGTGQISGVKKLGGGVTETFVGDVAGDGKVVFKTMNNSARQERAAYEISKQLGFGIVPPVAFRKADVGKGVEEQVSAMAFIPGKVAATYNGKFKYLDMAKITAFDFIIGNQDRHPDNFIIDERGKTWAIDNAFAFGTAKKTTSATYPAVADKPIPGAVLAGVKRLAANRASLESKLASTLGDKKKAKALFDRATELSKMTHFPKDRFSFYRTWEKKHGGYTPERIKSMVEAIWQRRLSSMSTTLRTTRMLPQGL